MRGLRRPLSWSELRLLVGLARPSTSDGAIRRSYRGTGRGEWRLALEDEVEIPDASVQLVLRHRVRVELDAVARPLRVRLPVAAVRYRRVHEPLHHRVPLDPQHLHDHQVRR